MSKAIGTRLGDEKGLVREYMLESSSYQTLIETETSLRLSILIWKIASNLALLPICFPLGRREVSPSVPEDKILQTYRARV